jgi:hypothetical protein
MTTRALLSAFLVSASAFATSAASLEEGAEIKSALQAYVGSEPGVVEVTSPVYALSYKGTMNDSLAGFPTGRFNMKVRGFDTVIAKVQAAAVDPMAQQAMGGLIAAKGMGKAEPDGSLSYEIDIQPMAQVFVNGVNVSAMAGAPPPQP